MDLVERLRAAIDEDERAARYALQVGGTGVWTEVSSGVLCLEGVDGWDGLHALGDQRLTRHMEVHDPARVLRQVAAHREILAEHEHMTWGVGGSIYEYRPEREERGCRICAYNDKTEMVDAAGWCATVRALARAYGIEVEA